jgi:hypothetical protein
MIYCKHAAFVSVLQQLSNVALTVLQFLPANVILLGKLIKQTFIVCIACVSTLGLNYMCKKYLLNLLSF